jgi:hypothetical protein
MVECRFKPVTVANHEETVPVLSWALVCSAFSIQTTAVWISYHSSEAMFRLFSLSCIRNHRCLIRSAEKKLANTQRIAAYR